MKTYRKIVRRRLEAALSLSMRSPGRATGPVPRMDPPIELPSEVIDLATGPFEARFPDLGARSRRRRGVGA
jgi:hypothetical protein